MKPEEQRIAIAKACGWIQFWQPTGEDEGVGHWEWHRGNENRKQPPDYLNDLNAMHEAEEALDEENAARYGTTLLDMVISTCDPAFPKLTAYIYVWHANAAQRAEAFLRTLGLWKEEE